MMMGEPDIFCEGWPRPHPHLREPRHFPKRTHRGLVHEL